VRKTKKSSFEFKVDTLDGVEEEVLTLGGKIHENIKSSKKQIHG